MFLIQPRSRHCRYEELKIKIKIKIKIDHLEIRFNNNNIVDTNGNVTNFMTKHGGKQSII